MTRVALNVLSDLIEKENEIIAVLPTGYGKTTFLLENKNLFDKLGRVIHALPLQAIIRQLYIKLKNKGFDVGYQMALQIPEGDKRPFLSKPYMVTTIDSFLLDFYGIPVHEIFRAKWHSDLAFLISRVANLLIFDEFHLVTALEAENAEEEYIKIIEVVKDCWSSFKKGKKLILTATLSPSIIAEVSPNAKILVYAPDSHAYIEALKQKKLDPINIWNIEDSFYNNFYNYLNFVRTYIVELENYNQILKFFDKIYREHENKKVLVVLNHAWKVEKLALEYGKLFIHGFFGNESKGSMFEMIEKGNLDIIFASQVIEAGLDIDYDVLITDIAPAYALIQRAGRIARNKPREAYIYIIKYNISEQVRGVYSEELTKKTLEKLMEAKISSSKMDNFTMHSININWRLPISEGLDYLKLVLHIDDVVANIIKQAKNSELADSLEFLKKITLKPAEVIGILDEKFSGSFIRSSSLIPIAIDNEIVSVSMDRFFKIAKEIKGLKFRFKKMEKDAIIEDEVDITKEEIERYIKAPLRFLRYTIWKCRKKAKEEDENLSGYLKIIPLGFVLTKETVGKISYFNKEFLYLKLAQDA
ncbi:MAG TPA: DEAD/DEAH box helicase [Geobacterales bacterium]|nr:DEAD/DEAH box helicase [Geobacterales bacterium]